VDDEEYMRCILAYKVQQAGTEVLLASDGAQGLELALQRKPNLIVTDYQMPLMNGLEMSRRLALEPETADVPIIMITARSHHVESEELARTRIRCVVEKPFSGRELMSRVRQALGLAGDVTAPTVIAA
jgi:two-component system, OmpR family, phosphate regulon response regulator PhoB